MEEKADVSNSAIGAMFLGEDPESSEIPQEAPEEEIVEEQGVDAPEEEEAVEEDSEPSEDDEAPEEESNEDSDVVEIEWEGQLFEAPKEIAEALMRQSDYTKKTQEVSEQRKAVEIANAQATELKSQYEFAQKVQPKIAEMQQLSSAIEQAQQYIRENIDNLSSSDIEKYRFGIDDTKQQIQKIQQSIQQESQEFQQAQEQSHEELLKKGTEVLKQRIPGWGEQAQKQVRDYAMNSGFSESELNNVVDPRHVETLWKAAQYDALKSGSSAAVKKVATAPTIKPKSRNPMPKETQDKLNLRKKLHSNKLTPAQKQAAVAEDLASRWT